MNSKMERAARKYWIGCSGLRLRVDVDHDTSARLLHDSLASTVVRPYYTTSPQGIQSEWHKVLGNNGDCMMLKKLLALFRRKPSVVVKALTPEDLARRVH